MVQESTVVQLGNSTMTRSDEMERGQIGCAILATLADHGSLHVLEIAQEIGRHPITTDRICTHLYDIGHIHSLNRGRYQLTDRGRQRLADDSNRSR